MKKTIMALSVVAFAANAANAAIVTSEDGATTTWDAMDFTTTTVAEGQVANMDVLTTTSYSTDYGRIQGFTVDNACTIDSLSILALRVDNGGTFVMDVFESYDGDGSTWTGTPSKYRTYLASWCNPIASIEFAIDSSNDIASGGVLTIGLEGEEKISAVTGSAYAIQFRRVSEGSERLLWNYATTDTYADGLWGYANKSTVAGREFAVGYTAIPEPATVGLFGLFGVGLIVARRKARR